MPLDGGIAIVSRLEFNQLREQIENIQIYGGRIEYNPQGINIIIEDIDAGSGSDIAIVKLKTKTDDTTYVADLYGDGKNQTATEEDITVRILDIAAGESIPLPNWFFASKHNLSSTSTILQWTIDVPRWLSS